MLGYGNSERKYDGKVFCKYNKITFPALKLFELFWHGKYV